MNEIIVTLEDQERLGLLPEKKRRHKGPTARELTAANPLTAKGGKVGRKRRKGPWWTRKALRHRRKMTGH